MIAAIIICEISNKFRFTTAFWQGSHPSKEELAWVWHRPHQSFH